MSVTQIGGDRQIKDLTIANLQIATDAAVATSKLADSDEFIFRDGSVPFTSNLQMGADSTSTHRIVFVSDPVDDTDAVNKGWITQNFIDSTQLIKRDDTSNVPDGVRTQFTLNATPVTDSEEVFLNGVLQDEGSSADYTITTDVVTFTLAPDTGDLVRVNYVVSS